MNSRERVMRALRRDGMPDRVPLQFDLCRPLLEAFSAKYGIPVSWFGSYYEDLKFRTSGNELRIAMGSDCVVVGGGLPTGHELATEPGGIIVNEFGMRMKPGLNWMDVISGPLEGAASLVWVGSRPDVDPVSLTRVQQGGFVTASLAVAVRLARTLSARVRVDNVADRSYQEVHGYPAPGRRVVVGLETLLH